MFGQFASSQTVTNFCWLTILFVRKNSLLSTNLDLDYVEILIRERFLFGKKDETIYLIKKDEK